MNILAIETSCDETAAAVVCDGRRILANVVSSQIDVHAATGGIVPEVAARLQIETTMPVVDKAIRKAQVAWDSLDAIAVTQGPGLISSLLVGVETAKALAYSRHLPLIPVNHLAGHLYACLRETTDFHFPYLGLIVSGGHTELVLMKNHHHFQLLGSTRDDAAGEAFDKVGKLLGLPYPGGPAVSQLAKRGNAEAFDFPRAMTDQPNYDFSFSGLKTAVLREIDGKRLSQKTQADLAASFQQAVIDTLVTKTKRAAIDLGPKTVLLGGGVAANPLLRESLARALAEIGPTLLASPPEMTTDNAAMIGLAAFHYPRRRSLAKGGGQGWLTGRAILSVSAEPNLSLASLAASDRHK